MKLIFTFLFLLNFVFLQGQIEIRNAIKNSFENKEVWITEYSGLLDGVHQLKLFLADNGKKYIAQTFYVSSGEVINYSIYRNADDLILTEVNSSERKSGHFKLKKVGNDYQGTWYNRDGAEAGSITFHRTTKDLVCGDYHFYYLLKSKKTTVKIERQNAELIVMKGGDKINASCADNSCNVILIDKDEELWGQKGGEIILNDEPRYMANDKEVDLDVISRYIMKCQEFINYDRKWSLETPDIDNEAFAQYLSDLANDYVEAKPTFKPSEKIISGRNEYQNYGWVEVSFLNEDFISGYMYFRSSEQKSIDKAAFVFNIKEGVEVKQEEILESGHGLFDINELTYLVLDDSGVVASSDMDPIYGEKTYEISYKEARKILKDKKLIKLAKENG